VNRGLPAQAEAIQRRAKGFAEHHKGVMTSQTGRICGLLNDKLTKRAARFVDHGFASLPRKYFIHLDI